MPIVTLGLPNHDNIPGVSANDHHTPTVAGDLNLADLAARAHGDLSDAPADAHHAQAHTVVSHSDTTGTGAELDTLTDASEAEALHHHRGRAAKYMAYGGGGGLGIEVIA